LFWREGEKKREKKTKNFYFSKLGKKSVRAVLSREGGKGKGKRSVTVLFSRGSSRQKKWE